MCVVLILGLEMGCWCWFDKEFYNEFIDLYSYYFFYNGNMGKLVLVDMFFIFYS